MNQKNMVVLGATMAGLACAIRLSERLRYRSDITITVIDEQSSLILPNKLFSWLMESKPKSRSAVSISLLLNSFGIKYINQTVASISVTARKVRLNDEEISYEYLILAPSGVISSIMTARPTQQQIKAHSSNSVRQRKLCTSGMSDHAFTVADYAAASRLKQIIHSLARSGKKESILIVGSGEEAVAIASSCAEIGGGNLHPSIICLDNQLLPHRKIAHSKLLFRLLNEGGVSVYLRACLKKVNEHGLWLADGRNIPFNLLIFADNLCAPTWLAKCEFVDNGLLPTRKTGQVRGLARVYAVGQLALFPPDYQVVAQDFLARAIADNIVLQIDDASPKTIKAKSGSLCIPLTCNSVFYVSSYGWLLRTKSKLFTSFYSWWQSSHLLPVKWLTYRAGNK